VFVRFWKLVEHLHWHYIYYQSQQELASCGPYNYLHFATRVLELILASWQQRGMAAQSMSTSRKQDMSSAVSPHWLKSSL
jgi:hypothetical protein